MGGDFLGVAPKTHGEPRRVCGAERGRLQTARAYDGNPENIRLKLHQQFVRRHAAVDAQLLQRGARVRDHRGEDLAGLVGRRLQRGSGDVSFIGKTREAGDNAARVGAPAWRVEARKGGHEINVAIVRDRARERFDGFAAVDDPEIVAQPLHQRPGDGDGSLQRVNGFRLAELIGERRHQPLGGDFRRLAGVHQQEAAGAVSVLGLARLQAGLPQQRALLVADRAGERNASHRAIKFARRANRRQAGSGDVEQS